MTAEDLGDAWLAELRAQTAALRDMAESFRFLLGIAATAEDQIVPTVNEHETPQ